jgi:Domain of unknown function (DUF5348)
MFDPYAASPLEKSPTGRWMLNGIDLTSGSTVDVNIDGHWIRIRIEHDSNGYYAIPISVRLHQGLWAKFFGK